MLLRSFQVKEHGFECFKTLRLCVFFETRLAPKARRLLCHIVSLGVHEAPYSNLQVVVGQVKTLAGCAQHVPQQQNYLRKSNIPHLGN